MAIAGAAEVQPAPGPRWTHKRLLGMLADCYGTGPRGGVNAAAIAAYTGVKPSTVYRWVAPGETQYRLAIPPGRLSALQLAPPMDELRALQAYRHALMAIEAIEAGNAWTEWASRGWLKPHYVSVRKLLGKPWQQVTVTRAFPSRPRRSSNRPKPQPEAGEINRLRAWDNLHAQDISLSTVLVPHWFYGQALVRAVIVRQWRWRVYPMRKQLPLGRTRVWMSDAPAVELRALARHAEIPVIHASAMHR